MKLKIYGNGTIHDAKHSRMLLRFEKRKENPKLGATIIDGKVADRFKEMGYLKPELEGKEVIGGWIELAEDKPKRKRKSKSEEAPGETESTPTESE